MDRLEVLDRVIMVVAEYAGCSPETIREDSNLFLDLGMESLYFVSMILDIQKMYNIKGEGVFTVNDLKARKMHLSTLGSICDYVMESQAVQAA